MNSKIKHLTIVQYFEGGIPWECSRIDNPSWEQVETAVKKMDNYYFPIVQLSCCDLKDGETGFDDEESFNIIGGTDKLALFHYMSEWQYERDSGGDEEIRLWDSDQGYFCQEKNVIYDVNIALNIISTFFQNGDYNSL